MGAFVETNAENIYNYVLNKLQEDVGPLYPGDERRMFAESLVQLAVILMSTVDDTAKQRLLKYARGSILDILGEEYTCTRLTAQKSTTTLQYTLSTSALEDVTIPAGTRVSTENGFVFKTTQEITIAIGTLTATVNAEAESGGEKYNGFLVGSITKMVDLISYIDSVTNTTKTSGGTNTEKDNDYRERIKLSMSKFSTAGPLDTWKYFAMTSDARISDVYVASPSACVINIYAAMKEGNKADAAAKASILAAVSATDVKPLGDNPSVLDPTMEDYDIILTYYVKAEDEIKAVQAIESTTYIDDNGITRTGALEQFRLWQDTKINRSINTDKLRELLMNPAGDSSVPGAIKVSISNPSNKELTGGKLAHRGYLNVEHEIAEE